MEKKNGDQYKNLIIVLAIILVGVLIIVTLHNGVANNLNEQYFQYALQAIEIADQYLDYKITATEAAIMIESLRQRESELPSIDSDDDNYFVHRGITSDVMYLSHDLQIPQFDPSSEKYNDILERRNELAEVIGEKKR